MKAKRIALALAALLLTLGLLTGCGKTETPAPAPAPQQTTVEPVQPAEPQTPAVTIPDPDPQPQVQTLTPEPEPAPEPEPVTVPDAPTEQDETSPRREFASDESGELTPGAEDSILAPSEEAPETPPAPSDGAEGGTAVETDSGALTVTETVPAEEADETGTDESGETADSVQTYYLTLLSDRLGDLFECKRLYVYWETEEDHRTVFKTSREHELILAAGAYDVSAKLLEENLTVDDGWVARKNPGVIVKTAGRGALDDAAAAAICAGLAERPEWNGLSAVQNGRVLVLSQSLLDTPAGRTAAAIYLAGLMYPDQFADIDADEALRALTEEADGAPWSGRYAYTM